MTSTKSLSLPFDVAQVGGVPFCVTTLDNAVEWLIRRAAKEHIAVNVRLANAYNVALTGQDSTYRTLLREEGMNLPDGTPVVWFLNRPFQTRSRNRRQYRAGRVRGPSLFNQTIKASAGKDIKHFLLGSSPETLAALERSLRIKYPETIIAGAYSPPFAAVDADFISDCVARVLETAPDLVWVGLGTPKQDILGTALSEAAKITSINVGAAFDFAAGTVREAPNWVQNSGFEWLYRLISEPRRLWRRYLLGNTRFVLLAFRNWRSKTPTLNS